MVILRVVCVFNETILGLMLVSGITEYLSIIVHSLPEFCEARTQLACVLSHSFSPVAQHVTYCTHGQDKMSDKVTRRMQVIWLVGFWLTVPGYSPSWWQEFEAVGSIAFEVGEQREVSAGARCFLMLVQSGSTAPGMVLPVVRVGLLTSINPI